MTEFSLSNKYSLELRWSEMCWIPAKGYTLHNAKFNGPVLQIANEILSNDKMILDFYKQFYKYCTTPFLSEVSWGNVTYESHRREVLLGDCLLSYSNELQSVVPLSKDNWLLIDTQNHTIDEHVFSLTYLTYIMDAFGELYDAT